MCSPYLTAIPRSLAEATAGLPMRFPARGPAPSPSSYPGLTRVSMEPQGSAEAHAATGTAHATRQKEPCNG